MRIIALQIIVVAFVLVGIVSSEEDYCRDVSAQEWDQNISPFKFSFGLNDGGGIVSN